MPIRYNCLAILTASSGQNKQDLAVDSKHRGEDTDASVRSVVKKNDADKSVDVEEDEGGNGDGNDSAHGGDGGNGDGDGDDGEE